MKIRVFSIPEEGLHISLDSRVEWVKTALQGALKELFSEKLSLEGYLDISNTGLNVSLKGKLKIVLKTTCCKCLEDFPFSLGLELARHFAPFQAEGMGESLEEEIALKFEDMNFSFYQGEEIDLEQVVKEDVLLALPMRFVCVENCPGLCPTCGRSLKKGPCQCPSVPSNLHFQVLSKYKFH